MTRPNDPTSGLRERAEQIAQIDPQQPPHSPAALPVDALQKTLHELRVHQIELEMQNEELRSAQLELDAERARYFDLYDLAPVGYFAVSEAGLILQANLKASSLLGQPRSALVKNPFSRLIAKTSQDDFYLLRRQLLETRQPKQCDVQMVSALGEEIWVQLTAALEADVGEALRLRIVIHDISERKQAEEALYESEDRFRTLFNSMDEGYSVIEVLFDGASKPVDFRYLEANPSFEKQSGLHDVLGKRVLDLFPNLEPYWLNNYGKVALTGEPTRFVAEVKELGRWFNIFAFRVGPPNARRVAVVFTNVTEIKRAEADRLLMDQTLLEKNTELRGAIRAAEKANQAKSTFLSNMSHELRTPLTAILGFAQLMDAGSPAPNAAQKRGLDQIQKAGWYLLSLINEVLDLAVIESGKLALTIEAVPVASVLAECEAMVEVQAKHRGINISFEKSANPYVVMADRIRLKQAIINLLSNAIKYNRAGGGVTINFNADNPQHLRICVEDTGWGLTPEMIAQLFQPFNRLGQESHSESGTGIGLVMTKHLIESMGGAIGVSSKVGVGSIFWIDLNHASQQVSNANANANANADADADADILKVSHKTVLYVEDHPANVMLVEDIIATEPGMGLLVARDGLSGVALARSARPDAILMDIHLQGLSGMDALRILRHDPQTAHIPVVALSANALPQDIQDGLAAGFFDYLTKPVQMTALTDTLKRALKSGRKPAESTTNARTAA